MDNDCRICGKTKAITEFVKDSTRPLGVTNECKDCKHARDAEYRSKPEVRVAKCAWQRSNGHNYRGKYPAAKYKATMDAWHMRNPDAGKAYKRLHAAIDRGEMPRAKDCTCVRCGNIANDYHHHNGYGRGHELDVIAICKSCHRKEHSPYEWPAELEQQQPFV